MMREYTFHLCVDEGLLEVIEKQTCTLAGAMDRAVRLAFSVGEKMSADDRRGHFICVTAPNGSNASEVFRTPLAPA
jgi:hypothetical protein